MTSNFRFSCIYVPRASISAHDGPHFFIWILLVSMFMRGISLSMHSHVEVRGQSGVSFSITPTWFLKAGPLFWSMQHKLICPQHFPSTWGSGNKWKFLVSDPSQAAATKHIFPMWILSFIVGTLHELSIVSVCINCLFYVCVWRGDSCTQGKQRGLRPSTRWMKYPVQNPQ